MTGWTWRSMGGGTCLADSLDWRERGTPDRRDSLRASRLCRVRFCWWRANSRACRWCIERRMRDPEVQAQTTLGVGAGPEPVSPTTLRLTAEPVVAASRCKHEYLHARKTDYCVNWGDSGGTLESVAHREVCVWDRPSGYRSEERRIGKECRS